MERERGSGKEWNKGDVEWGTGEERGRVRGGDGGQKGAGEDIRGKTMRGWKGKCADGQGKGLWQVHQNYTVRYPYSNLRPR